MQHYVMTFVNDLRQVRWFSPDTRVSSTNKKNDRHDITEILLKETVNINAQTLTLNE